ncbi:MAG: IS1380 family transposase [Candidatus Eisenbacteria sp.]|nr:IS1380 family transposase [Candidatus Eisenbacteria bacterium]
MPAQTTTDCVLFPDLFDRPLTARFDLPHASSDGGAVLLKAVEEPLGLIDEFARHLTDRRQPGKIDHQLRELLAQRIFGLACGYADANDAARLAHDPIHKLLLDRDPIDGCALASQPTLSRLENAVRAVDLYRLGEILAAIVIDRHRLRLGSDCRKVIVDLDTTPDPTHGAQQLSFFHGHYDTHCYLPLLGFLSFDKEPEQHLFTAILRAGNAGDKRGVLGVLRRLIPQLRQAFPCARILVRLDGGFAGPDILDFLDDEPRVDYVVGFAKNSVLKRFARRLMGRARRLSRQSGQTEHLYRECRYAARKWSRKRRVIIKAEVVRYPGRRPKDNPRFLVTNLHQSPRWIYERIYCHRGDVENRIKELKDGMQIDRTSCSRFLANQFRVLLTAAAYVLMQALRAHAQSTSCARAQVSTLRERLLKLGVQVMASTRRILLRLPMRAPFADTWIAVASSLGACRGG